MIGIRNNRTDHSNSIKFRLIKLSRRLVFPGDFISPDLGLMGDGTLMVTLDVKIKRRPTISLRNHIFSNKFKMFRKFKSLKRLLRLFCNGIVKVKILVYLCQRTTSFTIELIDVRFRGTLFYFLVKHCCHIQVTLCLP